MGGAGNATLCLMDSKVVESARGAFAGDAPALTLGAPLHAGGCHPECLVRIPLAMMNRHGLVAGATGTGKTRTLQGMAEGLSDAGVPVFVADIKGDLSGMAVEGEELFFRVGKDLRHATGEAITLAVDANRLHVFDPESGHTLLWQS